jgi:hypothetical protein
MTPFHSYKKCYFLITIDTEGDNLWAKPDKITTYNATFLPRFQKLCESYGFKPTYLTNYEMATCPDFQNFGKDILRRNTGEIGMHLHAWNTPPLCPLTENDFFHQPYLLEYPDEILSGKFAYMNNKLHDIFEVKIVSHRAGRWAFNEQYAKILMEYDYLVDCSITPYVSWEGCVQEKVYDFTTCPDFEYFLDLEDITLIGNSTLLEIPVTIVANHNFAIKLLPLFRRHNLLLKVFNRLFPSSYWLRPNGRNINKMVWILRKAAEQNRNYVEFMLHSSELMPGGSPLFPDQKAIELLYRDLKELFHIASSLNFIGATLQEYYQIHLERMSTWKA